MYIVTIVFLKVSIFILSSLNRGTLLLSRANLLLELVPVALRAVNIDASQRHEIIELLD